MKKTLFLFLTLMMPAALWADELGLYLVDKSDTNVRNAPGGKVVCQLPCIEEGYILQVDRIEKGWCRVVGNIVEPTLDEEQVKLTGSSTGYWIHNSLLFAKGMGDGGLTLYAEKSKRSKVVLKTTEWTEFNPIEISGKWVKVRVGKKTGWMLISEVCNNPLTNCC
ncbi:MAG: hypothetical protein KBT12_02250 [Bacteroidales bacterium]|nr:hypothetical protein [Candidatus Physcousia equi]